ncbi:MAG: glycosyltransferase [Bacteroidales bacterium]|nr:glycosyltransferase [Bacteroidales bacterium]
MRIFVLLSRIPYPLEKGDKLRAFHQIKALSKNNEIILCALNPKRNLDKQKAFRALQPYCRSINFLDLPWYGRAWNMLRSFFIGLPFQCGYFYNSKAARRVSQLVSEYKPDHIYCQLVRTAEYVKNLTIPKTIDYQDVFSHGMKRRIGKSPFYQRPFMKTEYKRLQAYEEKVFGIFDHKTIISLPDRELIPHPQREKIHVIPNGVDHAFFSPRPGEKKYDLLFTGNMAYPPNVDAAGFLAREILPIVWQKRPGTKLAIAGASPDRKVTALKGENITVSGWVDDIRDAYAAARVFIAPMRIGTGLQNKLLEAMSMNIPAITTPLANDALQAKDEEEVLIGSTAEELADKIVRLLDDAGLHQKIASKGLAFVRKNYSWEEATEKLNRIFLAQIN